MKQLKHFTALLILLFTLCACHFNTVIPHEQSNEPHSEITHSVVHKNVPERFVLEPLHTDVEAEAAMVIHVATGDVLFEKNINETVAVASMSKIMSELIVLEALTEGIIQWDDLVSVSDYAYTISSQPGFSTVHLQRDGQYTVGELFQAMAISSANGATIALTEAVSGSEKEFVESMNEKAKQLGLSRSNFVNSTGLTNNDLQNYHSTGAIDDKNMMSAKDLAVLANYMIENYPELLEITKRREFTFGGERFMNSNWMLPETTVDLIDEDVTFVGVDGFKTGFTKDAGYGFTGTVEIDNKRFISVVIGAESLEKRFIETKKLYESIAEQFVK